MAQGHDEDGKGKERLTGSDSATGIDRRTCLRLAGSAAAVFGVTTLSGSALGATTVNLGDEGLSEGDVIDPYLEEHFVDGNEVHVPEGTYQWEGDGFGETANASLIGDGAGAVLDTGDGFYLSENIVATSGTVHIKNLTHKGEVDGSDYWSRIGVWAESGATLVFENFNRPDGAAPDTDHGGFYVPDNHEGELLFKCCHVEGFSNNGLYGSSANGVVGVEGGLWRNNNVASIRLGSDGSYVRGSTIVHDEPIPTDSGGGNNGRGIWIRESGSNIQIDDCDITFRDVDGATGPILMHGDASSSTGSITNVRIRNEGDDDAISTDGDWDGDTISLTGDGNLDYPSDFTNVCEGSDCESPTTAERCDGETSSSDSTTSESALTVTTNEASDVQADAATLQGSLDDLGGASSVDAYFEYREAGASDWLQTAAQTLEDPAAFSETITGLTAETDYEFRAVADASDGDSTTGDTVSFTTPASYDHYLQINTFSGTGVEYTFDTTGVAAAGDASELDNNDSITENSDGTYTVSGMTGNGYSDDWYFDGDATSWSAVKPDGSDSLDYELVLDGRVVTPEELTGDTDLTVLTEGVTDVGSESVTLEGTVDDLGGADATDAYFEYRETGTSSWASSDVQTLESATSYTESVTGLSTEAEYEARAVAEATDDDVDTGGTVTFTTGSGTTDSGSAPSIDRLEVTEEGSPNPHADIIANWSVSDGDGDLSWALVQVVDADGFVVDAAKTSISGDSAADVNYFQIKRVDGQTFDVKLLVSDEAGHQASATRTVTE